MKRRSVRLISLGAILLIGIFVLTRAALAQTYTYTTLDDPNGVTSAAGINNSGDIVGSYSISTGPFCNGDICDNIEQLIQYGFLYSSGAYTALDYPGGNRLPNGSQRHQR